MWPGRLAALGALGACPSHNSTACVRRVIRAEQPHIILGEFPRFRPYQCADAGFVPASLARMLGTVLGQYRMLRVEPSSPQPNGKVMV
jgi:hypothetical protein